MMTAGHVAKSFDPKSDDIPLVGLYGPKGRFKTARVVQAEVLRGDVAVLEMDYLLPESVDWMPRIRWTTRKLVGLEEVRAIGYAFGLHVTEDQKTIISRAFQGRLVARNSNFELLGGPDQPPFPVYELPFMAPRGLSGSPLLSASGSILIHGIVIGNSESKMLVLATEEHLDSDGSTTRVEQYDTMRLGIASQGPWILELTCALLGGTIGNHLSQHGLLVDWASGGT